MGLFSDEGGQFLGGHAMNSDNRVKTLAALNDLWKGNPIRRTRSGEGHTTLHGRRLAVHLMVQPAVASEFMSDPLAADTGFLPRFLICDPPSAIGTRLYPPARQEDGIALGACSIRLRAILERPLPADPQTGELKPRVLPLSPGARVRLIAFHDECERQQAPGGPLAAVTGFASKAAEQAARIAGVLALLENIGAPDVSEAVMTDAVALARFYLGEALRLKDVAAVSQEIRRAEALRKFLLDGWEHPEVMARDVVQFGPAALRETPKARAALELLTRHGWLVALDPGTIVRGAVRKEAWRVVRPPGL